MGVLTGLHILCLAIFVGISSVCSQSTAVSTNVRKEHVCVNVDVRNGVKNFRTKLTNCTVIEGFLQILLIDSAKSNEYDGLSFPELREITGYLLLYRVDGLKSLATIFPNLSVIRGKTLFYNYALIAFEMYDLQDLGLPSLTTIENGAVRFEKNALLCHLDTIDWDVMLINKKDEHFFMENRGKAECANVCPAGCPRRQIDGDTTQVCWNSDHCQIIESCTRCGPGRQFCNTNDGSCCHSECFGGCSGPTKRDCFACRHVFHDGECMPACPLGTYEFRGRRCLTFNECKGMDQIKRMDRVNYKPFKNGTHSRCLQECPANYRVHETNKHECVRCKGRCPKICPGPNVMTTSTIIDSITTAAQYTGCNIVTHNLEITVTGGKNIASELEKSLGDIEEVHGYIKVARSYALVSLSFFRSLRLITGQGNKGLADGRHAFVLLDNTNLQDIWDLETHPPLTISRGTMFMHYNRKLCMRKIDAFINKTNINQTRNNMYISELTNGDEAACDVEVLHLEVQNILDVVAIIKWTKFNAYDDRNLLSYTINYREAPFKNISILDGKDACSTNVWKTIDYQLSEMTRDDNQTGFHNEIVHNLEPYTQYAIYVQTYTISSAKRGGISNLVYFKTLPKEPSVPESIRATAPAEGVLHVKWKPPKKPNGNVTHYIVFYRPQTLDPREFERRDYCKQKLTLDDKAPPKVDDDDEPSASNVSIKNGQCCTKCPKSKEEREREELEKQIQIKFENYLHSMLFQKRPDAILPGARKRRSAEPLPDYAVNGSYDTSVHASTIGIIINNTRPSTTPPTTTTEPEEDVWLSATVQGKLHTTLPNLKRFTMYNIQLIACHDSENNFTRCSNTAIATRRTLPAVAGDNIPAPGINVTHVGRDTVFISWPEPTQPNGLILLYDLQYQKRGEDVKLQDPCLRHSKYLLSGGYEIRDLSAGNYSVRVRATSLAGNGSWTDYFYFSIEENLAIKEANFWTPTVIGLIVGAMVLLLVISVSGVVIYFKRREARRVPDSVMYASVNPDYWGGDVYIKDEWEVDREKVSLLHELGQGSFGMVYEGFARDLGSFPAGVTEMRIAVKTVNENASMRDRIEFLNEASVMKAFNCFHVVRLLGVVSEGQPSLVVMELMEKGDLKNYLRMHRPDEPDNEGRQPPSLKQILQMAAEIADGMAYLVAKKFVHRDLAARNCMVNEGNTVKIGDFGMTRDVYETDYYRKGGKGLLPVRWMAPESLKDGTFTSASDVWSYGVVLWEMATLAAQPYQGLANEQVLKYVQSGGLMEILEGCPQTLYDLMMLTWQFYPKQRPTFQNIISTLLADIDPEFCEVSYYHSEENQLDLAHEAEKLSHSKHEEPDDLMDNSHTPLTASSNFNNANVYSRTPELRFANGQVSGYGSDEHVNEDSGEHGDVESRDLAPPLPHEGNPPLKVPSSVVEVSENYNNLDLRRESTNSHQTYASAIHSDEGGSKESSTSKSSSGSSHRNGFVNGHAYVPRSTEC